MELKFPVFHFAYSFASHFNQFVAVMGCKHLILFLLVGEEVSTNYIRKKIRNQVRIRNKRILYFIILNLNTHYILSKERESCLK